ncbi:hypothetical protein ACO1O0_000026 [Amphichorda felina]
MPHSPPSMAYPEQYKSIRRGSGSLPLTVETGTETLPKELGPSDVVIKIHAVSLNFRDVGLLHGKMPKGSYPPEALEHVIIASDCAAEVVALGEEVRDFHIGDHVSPIFDLNDIDDGEEKDEYADAEFKPLGGTTHGVLREYAVFDEKLLVRVPKYLSWEEVCFRVQLPVASRGTMSDKECILAGIYSHLRWCHCLGCPRYPERCV